MCAAGSMLSFKYSQALKTYGLCCTSWLACASPRIVMAEDQLNGKFRALVEEGE